jgi:succinate-acetate transporter protein
MIAAIMTALLLTSISSSILKIVLKNQILGLFILFGSILQLVVIIVIAAPHKKWPLGSGEIKEIRPLWEGEENKDE